MKMEMAVQIISKEDIKPSSPTHHHLKTFKFSLLDQFIPSPYAPIILFYPNDCTATTHLDIPRRLALLKQSLSETLTRFYPLAGKIKDDLSIECNDEGAYYVEARVNCRLDEFLIHPDLLLLHRFLPRELMKESAAVTYVTNVQVNVFDCGGIVIGICVSHKMLDGAALSTFLKMWSAAARGCEEMTCPDFSASSLFPANDLWLRDTSMVMWGSLLKKGMCVTRRFVFDASAIDAIKVLAASSKVKCPTRVEAVSAFIWKCFLAASKEKHGSQTQRPCLLTHLVNLRRRMTPPLSDNSTGNFLWVAAAKCVNAGKPELQDLVGELKEAISKLDGEFVKKLKSDEGNSVMFESLKEIGEPCTKDEVDYVGFSSWCKFGFYEIDFGWGKPIWVSSFGLSGSPVMNLVILVETSSGDGIEAWMTLDEQDMAILECNSEFIKFASMDPSPLKIGYSVPCS